MCDCDVVDPETGEVDPDPVALEPLALEPLPLVHQLVLLAAGPYGTEADTATIVPGAQPPGMTR